MTAEDILQKSRLLTMIFVIVAQIFRFIVITLKKKVFIAFIKDVWDINNNNITFESLPHWIQCLKFNFEKKCLSFKNEF